MKVTFIILTIFFSVTFASPISSRQSSSIIDSSSQLLYIQFNSILQNTFQQLIQLRFELGEKLSQNIEYRSIRSATVKPAPWVSQLFGNTNSITTQWNNHLTQFFTNMPTTFENDGRSLLNIPIIKGKLYIGVARLLEELERLFVNDINQLLVPTMNEFNSMQSVDGTRSEFDLDALLNDFHQQISGVFDKTKEQLNRTIDDLIALFVTYWSDLVDQFLG